MFSFINYFWKIMKIQDKAKKNLNSIERYMVKSKSSSGYSFLFRMSTPLAEIYSVQFLLKVFHACASDT